MALPTDSSHLSDAAATYLTEYAGSTESQFCKSSIIRNFVDIKSVRGTNTLQNNRVGRTTLGSVTPGVRPDATPTRFGTVSVTVDTIIIARDNVAALDAFQSNFDHRAEIGMDHGKEIGKFFDEAHIIKVIHGAQVSPADSLDGAFGSGKLVNAGTGTVDGDTLEAAIRTVLVSMEEEDIDADEFVCLVRPLEYSSLLDSDKLIDGDFSAGHDFANGKIKQVYGCPVIKTARIPRQAEPAHLLGSSYNVSAVDATALAVIMHRRSLLAGETIPLTSDVYYDKKELQHFIDSHLAFGVAVNREDLCGVVLNQS